MKLILRALLVGGAFLLNAALAPAQTVLFTESFEAAGPTYDSGLVTHTPAFHDIPEDDYWQRVQDSDITLQGGNSYSAEDGTYYWATEDTDDTEGNGNDEQVLDVTGINISGFTSLTFLGLFAADGDDGILSPRFDTDDHLHVLYQIDGGGFSNGIWFESSSSTDGNTPLRQDAGFDGVGEGTQVTATFTEFSFAIAGTGSTLDLRFLVEADAPNEEMAFDYLRITGTPVPEPSTVLLVILACGLAIPRRR